MVSDLIITGVVQCTYPLSLPPVLTESSVAWREIRVTQWRMLLGSHAAVAALSCQCPC